MNELRPNAQRAKTAIVLIWIVMGFDVISAVSDYFQYELLKIAADGGSISQEQANSNDLRQQLIGAGYLIAFIISSVTFIQWFRRAYYNLHQLVDNLKESEGWAAGAWFVPILSLFKPYNIMKEMYVETDYLLEKQLPLSNSRLSTNTLGWWWGLWILSNIMGQIVFRTAGGDSVDQLIENTILSMVNSLIGIPLAVVTVKVINDYAAVEPLLPEIKTSKQRMGQDLSK